MTVHVALLRGINVGGNNALPMKALAEMFVAAGCSDVRTYIQSGNVVFRSKDPRAATTKVAAAVTKRFGLQIPMTTRTAAELRAVAGANPFPTGGDDKRLHVAFLADRPRAPVIALLDPQRSPGDEFAVVGREIYLSFPGGAGKTKLTNAYFDAKLGTISTLRNWRTVLTLVELCV